MGNNSYTQAVKIFEEGGPFFHIFSIPPEKGILFSCDSDYREATNILALSVTECECKEVAYAIMSNHLHNIVAASIERCRTFTRTLQRRIKAFLRRSGKSVDGIEFRIIEITDLKMLRNEIAYVIRNPFAARNDVNPFAFPWCSGYLYFNPMVQYFPEGIPAMKTSVRQRRALKHERDDSISDRLRIHDGMILPSSFVKIDWVTSLFENARQFVWWCTRNVEAYLETADRLGEKMLLTDEEIFAVALKECKRKFGMESPQMLPMSQKGQLLRTLKFDYGATNKQLARCTAAPPALLEEMFPSAAP